MRRREFIVMLGAAAWPLTARAAGWQAADHRLPGSQCGIRRPPTDRCVAQRLDELGWVDGRNVRIERRAANGVDERAGEIASEFVRLNVDVILTSGDAQGLAAKRATTTIPIVIAIIGDPVGDGLVASLARPGGNVTGLSMVKPAGKRLELLHEVVPDLRRVAIISNVQNAGALAELNVTQEAARKLNLDPIKLEIRRGEDIPAAIESLNGRADALYVCVDPLVNTNRVRIMALAARLPVMHSFRDSVEAAGGLISYGPDILSMYRRAADLVDKILRGTKPADIPVEQPTKFVLVVNLKTAKALGLTVPDSILARADEVIE